MTVSKREAQMHKVLDTALRETPSYMLWRVRHDERCDCFVPHVIVRDKRGKWMRSVPAPVVVPIVTAIVAPRAVPKVAPIVVPVVPAA